MAMHIQQLLIGIALAMPGILPNGTTGAEAGQADLNIAIGVSPEGVTCVLGGALDGRMVAAKSLIPHLKHKQEYTLNRIGRSGPVAWAIGAPQPVSGEECEGEFEQELSLGPQELGRLQTALLGNAQIVARRLPVLMEQPALENSIYETDVSMVLAKRGFPGQQVKLTQVIKTDLDGDGLVDVVINAIDTARENARRGEYSILLIKPGTGGTAVPVSVEVTEQDADLPSLLWENTVVSIADLDGNGQMELVVYGSFYYGDGWQVYELKGFVPEVSLTCGCSG